MPLMTLFTASKPFLDPHTDLIQRNALKSWQALGEDVQVVLIGDEPGIGAVAREYGFVHLPEVGVNELGTPLISSIFALGRGVNDSPYLAYINADIILFPEFTRLAALVGSLRDRFLMVGQRWDLDVRESLDFTGSWADSLRQRARMTGKLHARAGSDYFIFPRACFQQIPDFAVGRAGWDNWMIYHARREACEVVDCTADLDIIHQNHDYRHLPGGQAHYRLPETGENIRLAGGRRTILDLDSATARLVDGCLEPMPDTRERRLREYINRPLLTRGNYGLTQLRFALFHPQKAWKERQRRREMDAAMQAARRGGK